jgi:hypothetical protein
VDLVTEILRSSVLMLMESLRTLRMRSFQPWSSSQATNIASKFYLLLNMLFFKVSIHRNASFVGLKLNLMHTKSNVEELLCLCMPPPLFGASFLRPIL